VAVEWQSLSASDRKDFLSAKGQVRRAPHKFTMKVLHWRACSTCGLLPLRNELTRKAIRAACVWEE
jgi:hypothetical protein